MISCEIKRFIGAVKCILIAVLRLNYKLTPFVTVVRVFDTVIKNFVERRFSVYLRNKNSLKNKMVNFILPAAGTVGCVVILCAVMHILFMQTGLT